MKRVRALLICALLMLTTALMTAGQAQAATGRRLFTLVLNDGTNSQRVPIYEFTDGTKKFLSPLSSQKIVAVNAKATKVTVTISNRSSLYLKDYKSFRYQPKVSISGDKSLKMTATGKDGKAKTFILALSKPKISSLTLSPSSNFVMGNYNRLEISLKTSTALAWKTSVTISNAKGKSVYSKSLGTKKSLTSVISWDGKPSKNNAAGLPDSEYVPAGEYRVAVTLEYKVGTKSKMVTKSRKVKVSGLSAEAALTRSDWKWKVILTGNDEVDYMAELICQKVVKNGMTEAQRAKALYEYLGNLMIYSKGWKSAPYQINITGDAEKAAIRQYGQEADKLVAAGLASEDSSQISWAKTGLSKGVGDCLIMSQSYIALLRHAGITATLVENDGSTGHHYWNAVKIAGKYYYCDINQATEYKKMTGSIHTEFFARGTKYFYQHALYSTVKYDKFPITAQISKTDCPAR